MTIATAASIARRLARDAVWHGGECTWIGRCPPSRIGGDGFQPLGPDLFVGTAGTAWFLAEAYAATRDSRIRRAALGAIRHAAAGAPLLARGRRLSLHTGAAGIALASAIVGMRTRDHRAMARAEELIDLAIASASRGNPNDLVTGAAGTIVGALALSAIFGQRRLLDRARELGDKVLAVAERSDGGLSWRARGRSRFRNLAGMAHGASGIAVALLELFAATGENRYRDAALDAFRYERSLFDAARGNWPDLTDAPRSGKRPRPPFATWWCHGAPGIALARIRACEILGAGEWTEEARQGLLTTLTALETDLDRGSNEPSLCHGLTGNAAVVLEGLPHLTARERRPARGVIWRAALAACRRVARDPVELPALFTGAAGVGWLNLRTAGAPVPSVLLLRREELAPEAVAPLACRSSRAAPRA